MGDSDCSLPLSLPPLSFCHLCWHLILYPEKVLVVTAFKGKVTHIGQLSGILAHILHNAHGASRTKSYPVAIDNILFSQGSYHKLPPGRGTEIAEIYYLKVMEAIIQV